MTAAGDAPPTVLAVDLGASGGRVLGGTLIDGVLEVVEHARFDNAPVTVATGPDSELVWDIVCLWRDLRAGLDAAAATGPVDSVGIDSWAVDYGVLDADGRLLGNPAAYRSDRTRGAIEAVHRAMGAEELFARSGARAQPFNTLYQLVTDAGTARHRLADTVLLIPDLLGCWLTGRAVCETTNASTTGMLDPVTRRWHPEIVELLDTRFGVAVGGLFAELVEPGTVLGPIRDTRLRTRRGEPTPLTAVGSHDTASAIAGLPIAAGTDPRTVGYVSSGTWSLVGVEVDAPVLGEDARVAGFTNELGVDETVRFLRNVTGMWIQQECLRHWRAAGMAQRSFDELEAQAAAEEPLRTVLDFDGPEFLAPGDMPARIDAAARRAGEPVPERPGQYLRTIVDSLALAHRRALTRAAELAGSDPALVHLVGGGSRSRLLCRLTADATGLPVVAGPAEGAALGNMLVQLRAIGAIDGGLAELRAVAERSVELRRHEPHGGDAAAWQDALRRFGTQSSAADS